MGETLFFDEAGLTARQRQVYELVKVRGHSIGEAAKALGISKSSAYYHLKRAIEKVERLEARREVFEKIRRLEERIDNLEQEFLEHVLLHHEESLER